MIYVSVTILILFLTATVHVFLYRTMGEKTVWGTKLFAVFPAGLVIEAAAVFWLLPQVSRGSMEGWNTPLPLSSILFYLLCTGIYFIFYISAFLGDESPATKIFRKVRKNSQATRDDLCKSFSDRELVIKRLDDMKKAGWITERRGLYGLMPRGSSVMKIIGIYRKILKWERSG